MHNKKVPLKVNCGKKNPQNSSRTDDSGKKMFFIVGKESCADILQHHPAVTNLIGESIEVHTKEQFEEFQATLKGIDRKNTTVIIIHNIMPGESTRTGQYCAIMHDIKACGFVHVESGNVVIDDSSNDAKTAEKIKDYILKKILAKAA